MKKFAMAFACAILAAGMMTGCGDVDENKTPAEIKAEAANWDTAKIEKQMEAYKKAIEAKAAELKKAADELAAVPLDKKLGEEGKKAAAKVAEVTNYLDNLKAGLEAYAEALKAKMAK